MTKVQRVEASTIIPTEQIDRRTEFTKTYAVGANKYKAFQSSIQIHSRNLLKGIWEETDARFKPAKEVPGAEEAGIADPVYVSQGPALIAVCGNSSAEPFIGIVYGKKHHLSFGVADAQPVSPEIPEKEKSNEGGEEKNPACQLFLAALEKAQGDVRYAGILPGVDFNCHTDGQMENTFTFHAPDSAREIVLLIKANGLKVTMDKARFILFTDESGETVFTICPPALFDAESEEGDVQVIVEEKEDSVRVAYQPDPAFMASAKYPVTLDPVIKTKGTSISVVDTFASSSSPSTNYSTHERIYASNTSSYTRHGFLRFDSLPALGSNHFITNAKLALRSIIKPTTTVAIYAREITEAWTPASVTYNAMPAFNTATILDYARLESDGTYSSNVRFDLTGLVRKWYHGTNNGVALTACEIIGCNGAFYSSDSSANGKPYLEIEYASLAGLESYLTYDAISAGKAGTGQVSLANGNLIFLHQDTAMNGARMPVSVTHVYNSCDADTDPFGCGYGWRTNYHQTLHKEYLDSKVYYVWTDGDGTEHWFKPTTSAATKYKDESGLSMELVPGTDAITIRDKGDNIMTFPVISEMPTEANPTTGKVLISSIADACGNTAAVNSTGMKINSIADGAGRITIFVYSGNMLSKIKTPWHTDSSCVQFTYTSGCLTGIQYEDGNSSSYLYNQNVPGNLNHRLLTRAIGPEGVIADFTFSNAGVVSGLPHVVQTAKCWDGSDAVASDTAYAYGANLCLVTDQLTGNSLRYHFNDSGNCTSVDDGLGYAVFAEYDQSGANADAPINHPTSTSRIQRVVNNLLADGLQNKTSGSEWTKYGTGTIEQACNTAADGFGYFAKKFTVANGNTLYLRQTVSVIAEKTYTLSGYAQSLGAMAYLRVIAGNETFQSIPVELLGTETQTDLERTQVTFTVPSGVTSITCDLMATGTARGTMVWWDSAQLEEGESANHVNLIENSRMNRTAASGLPDCWIADDNCASFLDWQPRSGCSVAMPENLPGNALHVAGRWNRSIRTYQTIRAKGNKGDKLTMGGWCSAYAKKTDTLSYIYCRMQIWFCSSNSSTWTNWTYGGTVDFNHEEGNWQFACNSITAPRDFSWVRVAINYNRQMNYADFSNLFLYKEQYGTDYVYDAKGNRKSATAPSGNAGKSTYDDYNNILTSAAPGRTVTTTYNWGSGETQLRKHLLQYSITPTGIKTGYLYDAYGNPTQTRIEDSTGSLPKYIQTSATYTTAGTYVATQTDARGKVVTTVTDPDKGIVTKVTDPMGQEVNSQYDVLRRLTKTSTMLTATQEVKSENTYNGTTGYLTTTKHNTSASSTDDVAYNFGYDSLGRQTSVSVGSNVLSTTYYDAIRRTVDHIVFGNGGAVQYLYDSFSRVIGIRYDGASTNRFSYGYDAQGRVAYVIDHARGVTVYTDYDLAGRPCQKTHMAGAAHHYTGKLSYNSYDLPNEFTEYVGAARARYTTGFSYDDENRVETVQYSNGMRVRYYYDKLGRMHHRNVGVENTPTIVGTEYYFEDDPNSNATTPLVNKIDANGYVIEYEYDDAGRITAVKEGTLIITYEYDAIGQLIRVNDPTDPTSSSSGTTWVYSYDLGGNILTKAAYPYTTGTVGTATVTHTYTYGNAGWKDQLTAHDGVTIQYDSIGNPVNDGTWSYTWQHGKQLQQMQKTVDGVTTTVQFEYNEDGLRTKKTVTVGNDTVVTEYVLHGKNIVHMTRGTDEMHFFYGADDKPAIVVFNGTSYRYLYTLQGDVIGLVDGNGAWVVAYRFDAWGKPLGIGGTMANTLGVLQPFRYRGYVFDEETGDYYLRSRYYRPEWGQFISADALIKGNLYCYCYNMVVMCIDEDGEDPERRTTATDDDFNETISQGMRDLLYDSKDYYYISRSRNSKGGMDCVWGFKLGDGCPKRRVYTANNIWTWYAKRKTKRGKIVNLKDLQPGDIVFQIDRSDPNYGHPERIKSLDSTKKSHVGIVVLFDFDGDGELELAVFQCCSVRLSEEKWLALYYGDTGPNITALQDKNGHSNWSLYIRPGKP